MSQPATTRAEHHAQTADTNVRTAKAQLAWILARRDCREWAISSRGLAAATGYYDEAKGSISPSTVRDAIAEIRRERNLPVVSCSQGYYVIDDTDALARELERIQDEIETRKQTKEDLAKAFNRERYGGDSGGD